MTAAVTATGNQTFFGRTAKLVAAAGAKSHPEQAVLQIGDFLILLAAALASQRNSEDAIDQAVLQALTDPKSLDTVKQTKFVPFDPVHKKTVASVTDAQGRTFQYAKGAPQAIADLCHLDPVTRGKYDGQVNDLAGRGYRALGVASSSDDGTT